ncbi:hypothetical protein Clacol_001154 [Clathrus columnatus]|uniref:Uncharacterized protein n=1 Tax=Clathrus columnatus TaxID=1419009 RepID=A0AAV5A0L4_9AGAM|nr:hypothetical protein Clacol_001154 [Clathrus columnatus]
MARLPLQSNYPKFRALLEEGILMHSNSKSLKGPEKTSSQVQVVLDTLKEWTNKKNRLLEGLSTDDGSYEIKTKDIKKGEDKIYGVDMSTIDGTLNVLMHTAVQDVGLVARDVFEHIFYLKAVVRHRTEAITAITYEDLQELTYRSWSMRQLDHVTQEYIQIRKPNPSDVAQLTIGLVSPNMTQLGKQLDNISSLNHTDYGNKVCEEAMWWKFMKQSCTDVVLSQVRLEIVSADRGDNPANVSSDLAVQALRLDCTNDAWGHPQFPDNSHLL